MSPQTQMLCGYSLNEYPQHLFLWRNKYIFLVPPFSGALFCLFVCVEVLRPSQLNGVMSSVVILPNHMYTGQA